MDKEFKNSLLIALLIPTLSGCITLGICKNQLDSNTIAIEKLKSYHDADIKEVNNRVDQNNIILQSINNNLAELNTKVSLLIDGKIKIEKENK